MIPQRCYSDLFSLKAKIAKHQEAFAHNKMIQVETHVFIHALDVIIGNWEECDDKELSAMAEEHEIREGLHVGA